MVATRFFNAPSQSSAVPPADPAAPPHPDVPLAPAPPQLKQSLSLADAIALRFRDYLPNTTETYVAYDVTRDLYLECASQAAYVDGEPFSESAKFWYETCGRLPTFQSWSQVTILHMWMLMARMRALDKNRVKIWQQHFVDHFFYDAEDKMAKRYGITSSSQRSGYMKDLFHQYRGMTLAFDEGLVKGDAILATALWRNIFDASEDVDIEAMAMVTSYVRRAVSKLGTVDDEVILRGRVKFGLPLEERKVVKQKGHYLDKIEDSAPATETTA
jgi:cytochrome b pre-mRNA-processing protein 3